MNEQIQRIFQVISDKKMNQAQFSNAIGITAGSISHFKTGKREKVSLDILNKIINRFDDINREWLFTGKGTMKIPPQNQVSESTEGRLTDSDINKRPNYEEPINLKTSQKTLELFNIPTASDQQSASFATTDQTASKPDDNRNNIEKEVIIYKEKPPKTIEKLVIFFSDNTYETFVPGK